jgi:hypothetical protein
MGDWKSSVAVRIFPAHTLSDAPFGEQRGVSAMADNGFGPNPHSSRIDERLAGLRATSGATVSSGRKIRYELLIGLVIVLFSLLAVLVLVSKRTTPITTSQPSESSLPSVPEQISGLLDGEAYVSVSVAAGEYPPEMKEGDTVRIVVVPSLNSDGVARSIKDLAVIRSIGEVGNLGNESVVTLQGPENLAVDIAEAEKVHLSIVGVAVK